MFQQRRQNEAAKRGQGLDSDGRLKEKKRPFQCLDEFNAFDDEVAQEDDEYCTTLYRATISNSKQYTLLLVSTTTVVPWPGTVVGYTGRLVIQ